MKLFRLNFALALCVIALFSVSATAQHSLPEDFDDWLEKGRLEWKIPGMAVGIVKDGQVIYEKGFGEKALGGGDPVDAQTVFSIASVSKNMTAAALAILVDEGKVSWDDKVVDHIPWFRLKDPWVTREVTIRDLLTHRVGLGRILGNRLQFMTKESRDEVLRRVRYMEFEKPFRSEFVYNNVMYSLAGQIIEYVEGVTWDEFLRTRLFEPLGMHGASTTIADMEAGDNKAYPHQEIDGEVVRIPRRDWHNAGPAGGVNASVQDLNKWMRMQLGTSGTFENQVLVSEKQMDEIHRPQIAHAINDPLRSQMSYGFGWNIFDYEGKRVWTHGGATDGFNTFMYLMPELELGVVVVTNVFNRFGVAVAYQVMDAFLGDEAYDWNEHYLKSYRKRYEEVKAEREELHRSRIENTEPRVGMEEFVGVYLSDAYGKAEVFLDGEGLAIRFWNDTDMEAELEHWHYETFRAVWKNRALREEFMSFEFDRDGNVEALEFEFVLRPLLLQVGAYPSNYTHTERFEKQKP